jgi:hypothetical protein
LFYRQRRLASNYALLLIILYLVTFPALAQQSLTGLYKKLRNGNDREKISICLEISNYYAANEPDSAVHYCRLGIQLSEKTSDRHSQGIFLLEMGRTMPFIARWDWPGRLKNDALSIFRYLGEKENTALAYEELGS